MPQIDFTPENRRTDNSRADNLFKLKVGESARAVMLEQPTFAWVHNLRAPKIVNGKAVKVMKKRKGSDEEYPDFDYDFIGRPLCLGDYGTIADKGVDEKRCPACQAAVEGGEVTKPERRFAVNIIRYGLKSDGQLVTPFTCVCEIWAFTEGTFDKLYALAQEHGKLQGRDLLLGPCEPPEHYQRLKGISVGARDIWKLDDRIKEIVVETYRNNREADLETRAIGRPAEHRWLQRDVEAVAERWRIANGTPSAPVDGTEQVGGASLTEGLDDLLAGTAPAGAAAPVEGSVDLAGLLDGPAAAQPAPQQAPSGLDFSDLLGAGTPAAAQQPAAPSTAAPQTAPQQPAAAANVPTMDFDELLNSIS